MFEKKVLVPNQGKDSKLQSNRANSNIQNNIGVEAKNTLKNYIGVDSNNGSKSCSNDKMTDLIEASKKNTNNQSHHTTTSDANPKCLLFTTNEILNEEGT